MMVNIKAARHVAEKLESTATLWRAPVWGNGNVPKVFYNA